MSEHVKAAKLPWAEVSECISIEVSKILDREIICKANIDDHDYWAVQLSDGRLPLSELYKLMETVDADEAARKESLPESAEKEFSVNGIGMGVAELLLGRHLHCRWSATHMDEEHLWLLDVKDGDYSEA